MSGHLTAAAIGLALGNVKRAGDQIRCTCPLADEHNHGDANPSFYLKDGANGLLVCCHSRHEHEQHRIIEALKLRGLWPSSNGAKQTGGKDYVLLPRIPARAPKLDPLTKFLEQKLEQEGKHLRDRQIYHQFDYRDADGHWLFSTLRFDLKDGGKEIFPATLWQRRDTGKLQWRSKWYPSPRPLYGLDAIINGITAPVLIVEGEGKCDAANALQGFGYTAVGFSAGSNSTTETDFSPLTGRQVVIWPDHDEPGHKAAIEIAKILGPATRIVKPDPAWPPKHDIKNLIEAGWTADQLHNYIAENAVSQLKGAPTLQVRARRIEWLWSGRLARRKLNGLQGDPGEGKSLVTCDLAARTSAGKEFPDGEKCEPGNVIIISSEDDAADTLRPRLEAAGADLSRVRLWTLQHGLPTFPADLPQLEAVIKADSAVMVVLDPLESFLDLKTDPNSNVAIRRTLSHLASLAWRQRCCFLIVRHLSKDPNVRKAKYRGGGSIAITGTTRVHLHVGSAQDGTKVFALAKYNLSAAFPSLQFQIVPATIPSDDGDIETCRIEWLGTTTTSADDLLHEPQKKKPGPEPAKLEAAVDLLREELADGARPSDDIIKIAQRQGISKRTVWEAKQALGVKARKRGFFGEWLWFLPQTN